MNRRNLLATLVAAASVSMNPAFAADRGTKEDAVAMVKSTIAYYKSHGRDQTVGEINKKNPSFIKGDIYVVANDFEGVTLGHPYATKAIGKSMVDLRDADGKPFVQEMNKLAKSGKPGWVEYRYVNPVSKEVENKAAYVEAVDNMYFLAGIYR